MSTGFGTGRRGYTLRGSSRGALLHASEARRVFPPSSRSLPPNGLLLHGWKVRNSKNFQAQSSFSDVASGQRAWGRDCLHCPRPGSEMFAQLCPRGIGTSGGRKDIVSKWISKITQPIPIKAFGVVYSLQKLCHLSYRTNVRWFRGFAKMGNAEILRVVLRVAVIKGMRWTRMGSNALVRDSIPYFHSQSQPQGDEKRRIWNVEESFRY